MVIQLVPGNALAPTDVAVTATLKLVVVIPCLNEEATVQRVAESVPRKIEGIAEVLVVVVDDGSTDATAQRAAEAGALVVRHAVNRGLGLTFRDGIQRALELGADLVVNIDGDGQFDPADIPKLLAPLVAGQADFATASRFKNPEYEPVMPGVKRWGNAQMARLVSRLVGQNPPFADVSCGFRAYTRETLLNLNLMGGYTYTQESFLDLAYKGFRIVEVPLRIRGVREFGESRMASSIPRYAANTALILLRTYRDYRPMRFFGTITMVCLGLSALLGTFFVGHYLVAGQFTPHVWAGATSGFLAGCALIILSVGMSADMLQRQRIMMEQVLYKLRKSECRPSVDEEG